MSDTYFGESLYQGQKSGLRRFGRFTLDLSGGRLLHGNVRVRIQPKPLRLLALLVERKGELVSRDDIRHVIWDRDVHLDFEHALNYAIRQVRYALQDSVLNPKYIETVPKLGYRFIAEVDEESAPAGPAERPENPTVSAEVVELAPADPAPQPASDGMTPSGAARRYAIWGGVAAALLLAVGAGWMISRRFAQPGIPEPASIAVLPTVNLTGEAAGDTLADGITEELIAQLSMVSGDRLRVIARTSAMYYKGRATTARRISEELNVGYVLESSIRRDGSALRLTLQLIRGIDEGHVWTHVAIARPETVYGMESDIAGALAARLGGARPALAAGERKLSEIPTAAEQYVRGEHFLWLRTRDSLFAALEDFKAAVEADPSFARAYAQEAITYGLLGQYGWMDPVVAGRHAETALSEAFARDNSLADAYAARGFCNWFYHWDWKRAEQDFEQAIRLDPSNSNALQWYSFCLVTRGERGRAREAMERAVRVDPKSQIVRTNRGWLEFLAGNPAGAAREMEAVLREDPGFLSAHRKLWMVYSFEGRETEAFDQLRYMFPYTVTLEDQRSILHALDSRGYRAALQRWLDAPDTVAHGNALGGAEIAVLSGDHPRALGLLETGLRARDGWLVFAPVDPLLDPLRSKPQFQQILKELARSSGYGTRSFETVATH